MNAGTVISAASSHSVCPITPSRRFWLEFQKLSVPISPRGERPASYSSTYTSSEPYYVMSERIFHRELLLHNAHIPPPPPPQPQYVNTAVSCRITLQPVSLDVRLEPTGADEVYVLYMYVHVCEHVQQIYLHPIIGCFELPSLNQAADVMSWR